MSKPTIPVIIGPTASGKTDYAISLAKEMNGEIVSADSRQIYAGMNIGTAKPKEAFTDNTHDVLSSEVIDSIPHFLFNVTSPDNPWTLPQWQKAAQQVLEDILSRGKQPILVGGTMLYVDSIVKNFSIPEVEPDQKFRDSLEQEDVSILYDRLMKADPDAKEFIEPHHKQRIIRALEVIEKTGKPFSASRLRQPSPYEFELIGLFPGWDVMKERIQNRISDMFQHGLLQETEELRKRFSATLPLLQTMNYKEVGMVLDNKLNTDEAIAEAVKVNMRYAKRQMAWWRNRKEISWK